MDFKITTNSIQKQFETSTQEIQESLLRNEYFCFQGMFYSTEFYIELSSFLAICLEKKKHFSKTICVSITYTSRVENWLNTECVSSAFCWLLFSSSCLDNTSFFWSINSKSVDKIFASSNIGNHNYSQQFLPIYVCRGCRIF